jgi:hypothetical protein
MADFCLIENWLGQKMIELRRFWREADVSRPGRCHPLQVCWPG